MTAGEPQMTLMGPFVSTHSRHFAQRARYTICTKYDHAAREHFFCNHSEVFETDADPDDRYPNQDILIKVTLPATERLKALEELSDYNINHFTLFQTEDALVKALAVREFELE